jgi:hypothetical protein
LLRRLLAAALVAMAGTSVPAANAASYFSNEASFQAAAGGGLSFESFEGFTATNVRSDRGTVAVAGFTLVTPNGNELSIFNTNDGGSHATHGSNYVLWGDFAPTPQTPTPNDEFVLNFSSPVDAFSMILTDPLDLSSSGASIGFLNNLGESTTIATVPLASGAEVFFGVISSGMTSISIKTSPTMFSGDRLGIDSVSFGAVPEPASPLLMVALAALTRRRRVVT